jgi:hypothetical protein
VNAVARHYVLGAQLRDFARTCASIGAEARRPTLRSNNSQGLMPLSAPSNREPLRVLVGAVVAARKPDYSAHRRGQVLVQVVQEAVARLGVQRFPARSEELCGSAMSASNGRTAARTSGVLSPNLVRIIRRPVGVVEHTCGPRCLIECRLKLVEAILPRRSVVAGMAREEPFLPFACECSRLTRGER